VNGNTLRTASSFDFEAKRSYSIRLRVTDNGGMTFEKQVTINVTNVNESPTSIHLSSTVVKEKQPIGTLVGNFTSTDPDSGSSFTYALVTGSGGTDNSQFTISGASLRTASVLEYELKKACSIRVRVTDASGAFFEKVFTISVVNQLEGTSGSDEFVLRYTTSTVSVSRAVFGGTPIDQGTFPLTSPLTIRNLSSSDSVRVEGTAGNDVISLSTSSFSVNGHNLILEGPASLTLAGQAGNDRYQLDADGALGTINLIDGVGVDTIDFSSTAASVSLNLAVGSLQTVNSNIRLILGSGLAFDHVIGGSGNDRLTGN
jgi:Ca2+-binding RTX toxin-like protein